MRNQIIEGKLKGLIMTRLKKKKMCKEHDNIFKYLKEEN